MEELLREVKVNEKVKYEVYDAGNGKRIIVDYYNDEVMGESMPLMEHEIYYHLKNNGLYIED